jgi:hypothetical protein
LLACSSRCEPIMMGHCQKPRNKDTKRGMFWFAPNCSPTCFRVFLIQLAYYLSRRSSSPVYSLFVSGSPSLGPCGILPGPDFMQNSTWDAASEGLTTCFPAAGRMCRAWVDPARRKCKILLTGRKVPGNKLTRTPSRQSSGRRKRLQEPFVI